MPVFLQGPDTNGLTTSINLSQVEAIVYTKDYVVFEMNSGRRISIRIKNEAVQTALEENNIQVCDLTTYMV